MPKAPVKRNAAAGAAGGAKKGLAGAKKSKLYNMPEKIKEGTILKDLIKNEWKIGPSIGTGGFGEIYSASKMNENKYDYVVKCEPHDNGPLFVEMHFYMRNAKLDDIRKFQKEHGLKSLGMPYMIGNGSADINGIKHRFIVLPRYGSDVAKHFEANGRRLPEGTSYRLALQMLDVYAFIHGCGYVHADLKAANILLGYGKQQQSQAYLVDFGLASHYTTKDFKPDPKKMHNGTIEYTSRDAHLGVPTMRADLEILGYNLVEWLGVELPWVRDKLLAKPTEVQKAKEDFMGEITTNLKKIFPKGVPSSLAEYFKYVAKMEYNETPDYDKCRKMFNSALKTLKVSLTGDLDFKLKASVNNTSSPTTSAKVAKTTKAATASTKTKNKIKKEPSSESEKESEDEVINASDDDDGDVLFQNNKKTEKKGVKRSLKTSSTKLTPKLTPKRTPPAKRALLNSSLKRTKRDSTSSAGTPSPSKKSKPSLSPQRKKISPLKQNTPLKTSSTSSKSRLTPLNANANANIRMSPAITTSSTRSGKTVINDRVTPNRKPAKTYEFNFELDVSMDANVIVNVKRKKKPLRETQGTAATSNSTPSGKTASATKSNSTPVTKVNVRKVGSGTDNDTPSPRTPAVTVKKSRRIQKTPS